MSSAEAAEGASPAQTPAAPRARETGLAMPALAGSGKKARQRTLHAGSQRVGVEWSGVTVVGNAEANTPKVCCKYCNKTFSGGATRIREHFLGTGKVEVCPCETEEYCEFKDKLQGKHEGLTLQKRRREAIAAVNEAAGVTSPEISVPAKRAKQRSIESSLAVGKSEELDDAIAELFYGCNISHAIVCSPLFKRVIQLAKSAPAEYKPPHRHRLGNDLLFSRSALPNACKQNRTACCQSYARIV